MKSELKIQKQREELKEASMPLMNYLKANYHPHVIAIVTSNSSEILEGIENISSIETGE